jgi:hypothetical protein
VPNSNINSSYANVDSNNYSAGFTSIEMPPTGHRGIYNNADAANASIMRGGRRKKISRKYRMKARYSKRNRSMKRGGKKSYKKGGRRTRHRRSYSHRGGSGLAYAQYNNDIANTPTFSLGGQIGASSSALANPPPYQTLNNNSNCADNYNHYTRK